MSSDEVALVLAYLAGDVPSLCAAACVARAWREAAAAPALWLRLAHMPSRVTLRLNAERLASLVARSVGGLERLDVSGAVSLSDDDLEAALRQPHALTHLTADGCSMLSAARVEAALASRRGFIAELRVVGLSAGPALPTELPDDLDEREWVAVTFWNWCYRVQNALRALLAPDGVLDGEGLCDGRQNFHPSTLLCGAKEECGKCYKTLCLRHREEAEVEFKNCDACGNSFCHSCVVGDVCDTCVAAANAD